MTANFRPPAQAKLVVNSGGFGANCAPPLAVPRRAVPSISGLIAFEATARHLSFSHAARELALTQGAVSKRVRQLENVLGVTLLARSRHKVAVTEIGQRYLIDVRRLLCEVQAATQSLQACKRRPTITIAVAQEIASYWLMPRLGDFHAGHPDIAVNFTSLSPTDDAIQPFGSECAICCVDEIPSDTPVEILFDEKLVPVANPDFLAALPVTDPVQLLDLPLISQSNRHALWHDWFAAQGLDAEGRIEGSCHDCLSLVLEAALNGHGVALAPVHAVRELLQSGRLEIVFKAMLATDRSYVFTVHPAFARQAPIRAFRRWIAAMAEATR